MRGKWAAGIVPRNFAWIVKGHLAVSERPGGSAPAHRRVRRHEEILWLRGQGFTKIVSLLPSPHNLHAYEELGIAHEHIPLARHDDPLPTLTELYPALLRWLYGGERILIHQDQLDERLAGVLGGFLYWSGMVPELPLAISAIENLLRRQLGATGRTIATLTLEIPAPADADRRRPERPSEAVLTAIAEGRLGPVVDIPRPVPPDEPDEMEDAQPEPEPVVTEQTATTAQGATARRPRRQDRAAPPAARTAARKAKQAAPKRQAVRTRTKATASAKKTKQPGERRRTTEPRAARAKKAEATSRSERTAGGRGAATTRGRAAKAASAVGRASTRAASPARRATSGRASTGRTVARRRAAGNA